MTLRPWISSYGDVPAQINADAYGSIVELLEQAMARYSDKTAFLHELHIGERERVGKLAVIEAMKMDNVLFASRDGVVGTISADKGESFAVDQVILEFA